MYIEFINISYKIREVIPWALREKYPYSEFFWSVFSRIRTRKVPNTDTFHAGGDFGTNTIGELFITIIENLTCLCLSYVMDPQGVAFGSLLFTTMYILLKYLNDFVLSMIFMFDLLVSFFQGLEIDVN